MNRNPLKIEAEKLRDAGYSYNMIYKHIGVAKSTLSNWFKDRPFTPNREVLKRIQHGPIKSAAKVHNRKVEEITRLRNFGAEEIGALSKRDLWLFGLGLYVGEGTKSHEITRIINSDPLIVKTAIRWFKDICGLENRNITIAIHIYPDNDEEECIKYWSEITGLSKGNFRKTQIDTRQNKSSIKKWKLPFGTAHITTASRGNPKHGVRLYRKINGWIHGAMSQL